MKVVALFIVLSCLASFAWGRKSFFRRTSTTTKSRGGLGPLGTLFAIVDVLAILVADGLGFLSSVAGLALGVISLVVFWWSVLSYGGRAPNIASTVGVPDSINTSGPYRYVRHPFYCSYIVFWLSVPFFLIGTVWVVAPLVAFLVMSILYYVTAKREEDDLLSSVVGDEYRSYVKSTAMFIPAIW